jgi:hypothetical protein
MTRKFLLKILAIAAGLVFIVAGIGENHRISRLKRFGTSATVIPPDSYTDHSKNGVHTFTAEISFKLPGGKPVHASHSVPSEAIDAMKANRPVTVFYDGRDPTDFVFEQDSGSWWPPLFGAAFIVFAFVVF